MLIWNRLKAHAASHGEKLAVVCGDTRLTYAQFVAKAEALAHSWLLEGLQPGDRVALHWRNGPTGREAWAGRWAMWKCA